MRPPGGAAGRGSGLPPAARAARGDAAAGATAFITNGPGDAGTRPVNYSNYSDLPSGVERFNLCVALNQVSDIDQRILL